MEDQKVAEVGEDVLTDERDGGEVSPENGSQKETNQEVHTEEETVERVAENKFHFHSCDASIPPSSAVAGLWRRLTSCRVIV